MRVVAVGAGLVEYAAGEIISRSGFFAQRLDLNAICELQY
jgi:hypothetical protein